MKKNLRRLVSLGLLLALLAIPTMAVLAKELGMLKVIGPGIKGTLTLNDPKEMLKLEQSGFFDSNQSASLKVPENLGIPYTITAHLNLDGKVVPFVQMDYYPAEAGKTGYVHYTGRLDGESMRKVDEWGTLPISADKEFRGLLDSNGVTVQAAVPSAPKPEPQQPAPVAPAPVTAPAATSLALQQIYLYIGLVAALLLLAGTGLALRRRMVTR
jgi:hypothetical protein